MYYCNEFYSLSVLSLYEGELLGKVDKLYFDKKMKRLIELELISEDGAKLTLSTKNIYHVGKNAITVKNNQAVNLKVDDSNFASCPINSKAYSITGEFLGVVKEISLDEKYNIQKISFDNNNALDVDNIASFGKNTIVFYGDSKINIKKFTPISLPKEFKQAVEVETKVLPVQENLDADNFVSKQPIQNADFLLGRVCTKDIFNFNNELLIKAHSIINKKNLKEINKFGKLRELMIYSK